MCDGKDVLLCRPDSGVFELEASCGVGETCAFGLCEPTETMATVDDPSRNQGTERSRNSLEDTSSSSDGADAGGAGPETAVNGDASIGADGERRMALCGNGVLDGDETCDPLISEGDGVCPTDCESPSESCLEAILMGSFSTCDALCEMMPITDAIHGDGCCPWMETAESDDDCNLCGNGVWDEGENCDPGLPISANGACPESCPDTVGCTMLSLVGEAALCTAMCEATAVTDAMDGDGCCPAGMETAGTDSDCSECGNGILEPGETCEVGLVGYGCPVSCTPASDPCEISTLIGSASSCTAQCELVIEQTAVDGDGCCPDGLSGAEDMDCAGNCGDGTINGAEACDGADFAGKTCLSLGYAGGGELLCESDCTVSVLGCHGSHPMAYEKVLNLTVTDDLKRVRWHPSGDYALMLGVGGKIALYDVDTAEVSLLETLSDTVSDIDVSPDGAFFLVSGMEDSEARLWRVVSEEEGVFEITLEAEDFSGEPTVVAASPDGTRWVVAAQQGNNINMLHIWSDGEGITKTVGYNAGGGVTDVMWANPSIYGGAETLITSDGFNGSDSKAFILDNDDDTVLSTDFTYNGNPGGAAWRPGGAYGFLTNWSSNNIYVYDGIWQKTALPGLGTAASPNAVGWNADGTRALVVGRPMGTPLSATVAEYRALSQGEYDPNGWLNISIDNYDELPWAGSSNAHLLSLDWRPESSCDEGLIVGADSGPSYDPSLAAIIRFYDQDDPDCAPIDE